MTIRVNPKSARLEQALEPGTMVVADDLDLFPEVHKPHSYMRNPGNGYVSVEVPIGDRMELSVRTT